jgi:SAM-dependent methyltransferase
VLGAEVVAVDNSSDVIAAARKRGLDARIMDARALTFESEFDAVFSNAVLHWITDDPDAPAAGAFRALRTGGRFVGEMSGHACVGAITVAHANLFCAALPQNERSGFLDEVTAILTCFVRCSRALDRGLHSPALYGRQSLSS